MSWGDVGLMAFYGSLAILAVLATRWKDQDGHLADYEIAALGQTMVVSYLVANMVYFMLPIEYRPPLYTMVEVVISALAALAFAVRPRIALIPLVIASALSVTFNIRLALALSGAPPGTIPPFAEGEHALGTNLCFAVECLLCVLLGLSGELRRRGLDRRPAGHSMAAGQDAAAQAVADFADD